MRILYSDSLKRFGGAGFTQLLVDVLSACRRRIAGGEALIRRLIDFIPGLGRAFHRVWSGVADFGSVIRFGRLGHEAKMGLSAPRATACCVWKSTLELGTLVTGSHFRE